MNYSLLFKNYKKELFSKLQYEKLDPTFRILAYIATIPFWAFEFLVIGFEYVYLFFFNCFASSADYLESWVKETRKEVKHATEAVIYFVSMPFIFFLRCILSFFSGAFFILWFISQCFGYIASLGGIRWQPFINSAVYDDTELKITTKKNVSGIVVAVGFVLFAFYALLLLISMIAGKPALSDFTGTIFLIYFAYMVIAVPVTFKKAEGSKEQTPDQGEAAESVENDAEVELNESVEA